MSTAHRNHHRRSSPAARLLHRARRHKKTAVTLAVICLIAAGAFGVLVYRQIHEQDLQHVVASNAYDMKDGYRSIEYKGKTYRYNSLITTVLYAGLDSDGSMQERTRFSYAPNADTIDLVVLDKKNRKMSVVSLNRDTMTSIQRFTAFGEEDDTYISHLTLAFAYGDGRKKSCDNLCSAVQNLVQVPITEYVVTNRSSLAGLNNLAGGVTVTVPNDSLAQDYPEFQEGAVVTLDAGNVEAFVRKRDIDESFSNVDRLERQQSFINAFIAQVKQKLPDEAMELWDSMSGMSDYIQTSVTKNKYL